MAARVIDTAASPPASWTYAKTIDPTAFLVKRFTMLKLTRQSFRSVKKENIASSGGGSQGLILAASERFPAGATVRIIDV
jgi:hypothetical protein